LNSIQVIVDSTIAREYSLAYLTDAENQVLPGSKWTPVMGSANSARISVLKSVTQYGLYGVAGNNHLPAVSFSYSNQMLLTDVENGQGGKVTFAYESINPDSYNSAGAPYATIDGDSEQRKTLYHGSDDVVMLLHVGEIHNINPGNADLNTPNNLPIRPGQAYRLKCTLNASGQTGQVKFGMYYLTGQSLKQYYQTVNLTNGEHEYSATVVLPANADWAVPVVRYDSGPVDSEVVVTDCSGVPVLTHFRVMQRTVSDTTTNLTSTYAYTYEGAAVNDTDHSSYAALGADLRSGASQPYSEFRGHSKVTVIAPDGLRTETYFYQNDFLQRPRLRRETVQRKSAPGAVDDTLDQSVHYDF